MYNPLSKTCLSYSDLNKLAIIGLITLRAGTTTQKAAKESLKETHSDLSHFLPDSVERAAKDLKTWGGQGINAVAISDPRYPEQLLNIFDPPILIFYRGEWKEIKQESSLAIVGSRRADQSGCQIAAEIAKQTVGGGGTIISGLAYGVDSAAHRGSLEGAKDFPSILPTIAVLGSGLTDTYPKGNTELANQIVKAGGLIISEFEPGTAPLPHHFLQRNRIISGLSQATLVIQATKRSGSLSTANHALEQGRDVLVVPGDIHDPRYEGSNNLIKQGAHLVTQFNDVGQHLAGLGPPPEKDQTAQKSLDLEPCDSLQSKILKYIARNKSAHYSEVKREFSGSPEIELVLLELELNGKIRRLPGNQVTCCWN